MNTMDNKPIEHEIYETFDTLFLQKRSSYRMRFFSTIWLLFFDLLALFLSGLIAVQSRFLFEGFDNPDFYYKSAPLLFLFPIVYALTKLYPGIGITPTDELRKIFKVSTLVIVLFTVFLFIIQQGADFSRYILVLFWLITSLVVPVVRLLARRIGIVLGVWGEPVVIIGYGNQGEKVLNNLIKNRLIGFLPYLIVSEQIDNNTRVDNVKGIPLIHINDILNDKKIFSRMGFQTIIIVPTSLSRENQEIIIDNESFDIKRIIMISALGWVGGSAIKPVDLQGILGFEIERNLINLHDRILKRIIDLFLVLFSSLFLLIIFSIISILIKLDSKGPIIFGHKRIGQNGKKFTVWKFRTMVIDADEKLNDYLEKNPKLKEEWKKTRKLKNDPRITNFGKFLRKTSLDELPQVVNVLFGNMSFVGPRPIIEDEIKYYNKTFKLYKKVKPGITGLWQVSGRSSTSYSNRISLDEYYIRHWSVWMDLYIIIRTIYVILNHKGAY